MKPIFTIFSFLLMFSASAQWTTDTAENTLVTDNKAFDVELIGASDGKTYYVFWKEVPAPTNFELRLQVLDADGNRTLGNEGVLVSNTIPMGTFTVTFQIYTDIADDLYIGVTGTADGSGNPAFVFKMDDEGNHLWNGNGVNIGDGFSVTMLPLSNGETIVSWLGSAGALMQKLDSDGNPIWATDQPIEQDGNATAPANFFELSDGDYMAVFHSLIGGTNTNLYAQRYDTNGSPQWTMPTQLSDKATDFSRLYPGVQDGDVVYMGYFALTGTRFDSFLQRINPDGSIPWGPNGSDFDTNETNFERFTEIAFEDGSDVIWSVCTYTNSGQSQSGEYVQKFDKTSGARLFTDNAKEVFEIGSEKNHAGNLQLGDGTPFFVIEDGFEDGVNPQIISVVYLDDDGEFVYPNEAMPIATFTAPKGRINFTAPLNGQSVALFVEDKGNGDRIYAQNFVEQRLSVADNALETVSVFYNNPVTETLNLKTDSAIENLTIYSITGQQVFNQKMQTGMEANISVNNLSSGYYLMNLETEKGLVKGLKIIKQ